MFQANACSHQSSQALCRWAELCAILRKTTALSVASCPMQLRNLSVCPLPVASRCLDVTWVKARTGTTCLQQIHSHSGFPGNSTHQAVQQGRAARHQSIRSGRHPPRIQTDSRAPLDLGSAAPPQTWLCGIAHSCTNPHRLHRSGAKTM